MSRLLCIGLLSWRAMPSPEEEFVKVVIDISDPDMDVGAEGLWAVSLGNDVYEIRNSPWYARNINWGDWVRAVAPSDDESPIFESVVKRSGHRTIHLTFLDSGLRLKEEILGELNKLGASYENNDSKMYALDCPPETDATTVIRYLEKLEGDNVLEFEVNLYE
jgi:Domain of unknown function (DUF4265)